MEFSLKLLSQASKKNLIVHSWRIKNPPPLPPPPLKKSRRRCHDSYEKSFSNSFLQFVTNYSSYRVVPKASNWINIWGEPEPLNKLRARTWIWPRKLLIRQTGRGKNEHKVHVLPEKVLTLALPHVLVSIPRGINFIRDGKMRTSKRYIFSYSLRTSDAYRSFSSSSLFPFLPSPPSFSMPIVFTIYY